MASGITSNPSLSVPGGCPLAVEYTLELSDHLALDMFLYDKVLRKRVRFRIEFYGSILLCSVTGALLAGFLSWSSILVLDQSADPFTARVAGYAGSVILFVAILSLMLPNSPLHKSVRTKNEKRFRRAKRLLLQHGMLRCPQRYRVVLTPEWFTETTDFYEKGIAVEITEHKEIRVWRVAVTSIDVAGENAFSAVKDKGWLNLPRKVFTSAADFHAFVELARSYREAALRATTPSREHLPAQERIISAQ